MSDFLDAAVSFPTVVFTVTVVVAGVYWLATIVGGFDAGADGADALDGVDGAEGALDVLGLTSVPPAVAISLVAVFGWFASLTTHVVLGPLPGSGIVELLVAVAAAVGALVVGTLAASVLSRPLARLYETVPPNDLSDFVGQTCVIRTGRVDATFGQAEVDDPEGASLLIEVRCAEDNTLHRGDEALIFDLDPVQGWFEVTTAPAMS